MYKFKNLTLVILCGGKGSRIKHLNPNNPKSLVKFGHVVFLRHLLNFYAKYPFREIYLMCGYKGKKIHDKFHNKYVNLIKIKCIIEKKTLGTAGPLGLLKKKIDNDFLLVNGDSYLDYDIFNFINSLKKKHKILLVKNKNYRSNNLLNKLSLGKNSIIEKSNNNKLTFMNAGVYFFKKKILKNIDPKETSLEKDIINDLINKKMIEGYISKNFFIDFGTPKNFLRAKKNLVKRFYKPALFLDRDGVINYDFGHVSDIKNVSFYTNIFKLMNKFINDYHIFIVTNQSAIGRGYISEKKFRKIMDYFKKVFLKKKLFINDIAYCPHHPKYAKNKYKINCNCRKPKIGMIKELNSNFLINLKKSIFIGDRITDYNCARKSKIKYIYKKDIKL